jgi:protein phosphatase/serine/threonine-protein phosphatase Stp1
MVSRPDLGLWAVADGAGGHARGDVAARMAVEALEAIPTDLTPDALLAEVRQRLADTHAALLASRTGDPPDLSASTIVVLVACGESVACLWAGDSRAYLSRKGRLEQVTRDHSLVQELIDAGAISAAQAKTHPHANVITRALGADGELDLEEVCHDLRSGDRFLLCSDGLCKTVPPEELSRLLQNGAPADALIAAALAHQGRDNVTAVVIENL